MGLTPGIYKWTWGTTNPDSYQLIINSSSGPVSEAVPGPLPVLGAAAAFGFSRKLRKRIKRSANLVSSSSTYGR